MSTLEQQTQVAEYQQKVGVISPEAQQQEEARLGQLQQELLQAQGIAEQELAQRRDELVGLLLEQLALQLKQLRKNRVYPMY